MLLAAAAVLVPAVSTELNRGDLGIPLPPMDTTAHRGRFLYIDRILAMGPASLEVSPLFASPPVHLKLRRTADVVRRELNGDDQGAAGVVGPVGASETAGAVGTAGTRRSTGRAAQHTAHAGTTLAAKHLSTPRREVRSVESIETRQATTSGVILRRQTVVYRSTNRRSLIAETNGTASGQLMTAGTPEKPTLGSRVKSWFHSVRDKLRGRGQE